MNKTSLVAMSAGVACLLFLTVIAASGQQTTPTQVDKKKILAEIAGDYDVDIQGQVMTVTFFEREGNLYAAPAGETAEQLQPVKGDNPLKFDVTVAGSGQYYEIEFRRNDKGAIDKCIVRTQGAEFLGVKKSKAA